MRPTVIFAAIEKASQASSGTIDGLGWVVAVALAVAALVLLRRTAPARNGIRTTEVRVGNGRIFEAILRDETSETKPKPKRKPKEPPPAA